MPHLCQIVYPWRNSVERQIKRCANVTWPFANPPTHLQANFTCFVWAFVCEPVLFRSWHCFGVVGRRCVGYYTETEVSWLPWTTKYLVILPQNICAMEKTYRPQFSSIYQSIKHWSWHFVKHALTCRFEMFADSFRNLWFPFVFAKYVCV